MNENNTNFFESVAHHNLERFHSETISWVFNTFPMTAKNFIKSVHKEITSFDEIKLDLDKGYSWAEFNQIDILLKYSYNSKNYQIIIENKIKASEHKIEANKLLKKVKNFDKYSLPLNEKIKLSQTEYYYFREKMSPRENIENCWYVYLKPSRVRVAQEYFTDKIKNDLISVNYNFDELNAWNKKLGDNPWITITYKVLIEIIKGNDAVNDKKQSNENIIIANAYIKFIEDNIKEEVCLDDFTKNEEYARFDYYKLLFALVKSKFKDVSILNSLSDNNEENSIDEYLEAGSSNGRMPLFAFYKKIKLPKDDKFDFFKTKREFINIGIQVQGENIKAYVSAETKYYDSTKINEIKKEVYAEFVRYILYKITQNWKRHNSLIFTDDKKGYHPNTSKTFYSRSYKIENFINKVNKDSNIRDIFDVSDEIFEKVNDFVNFDITDLITSYNK